MNNCLPTLFLRIKPQRPLLAGFRHWQIATSILLAIGTFHHALADDEISDTPPRVVLSDSADQTPAVTLEPMTIMGTAIPQPLKSNTSILKGRSLRLQQGDTLGTTLDKELGLSNASYGPGVGVPVIRGLTGSRVRMLQSGIGSHDATSLSPDHAVAIDPLFAEEISIIRGPETIKYGGNAIGGIVDVKDYRIPERVPQNLIDGSIESRYDTNGHGTNSAFKLNLGKEWLALSLGGFLRDRGDTRIPGKPIDEAFIQQQFGLTDIQNVTGKIPNTDSKSTGGFAGISWLGESAMAGMSISHMDNRYGVPKGSHGLDPNHLDGLELILPQLSDLTGFEDIFGPQALFPSIRMNMRQTRYDFKSEWYEPIRGIERIGFRYGLVDYQHTEIEGGTPFTQFKNDVGEGRFEIDHNFFQRLTGTVGVQWINRDFAALGVETFVPETRQNLLGLYTTQQYAWDNWIFSSGLRFEQSRINPRANQLSLRGSALPPIPLPDEMKYRAVSASASVQWLPLKDTSVMLLFNHSKRSPDIQELLSLGPHLSTRSFDIGNVQLTNETMNMIDLGFNLKKERFSLRVNGYYNRSNNFIYQRNTGLVYEIDNEVIRQRCVSQAECVSIFAYDQRNAEFIGYESELEARLYRLAQGDVLLTLFSDYVRGRFVQGGRDDIPRLPPLRYGTELGFSHAKWHTALRYTRAEAQNFPGENETRTRGYHLLTVSADYQMGLGKWADLWLFVRGTNLLNEEIRSAVSFLRNFAPEPGRSLVFGLRATF
ncbi:TonB-dependent receptor [Nitrosomonas sp. ANs5]|uniref:TonB-dependent receptor n=1 Tax=Nitrosomonas sp. ANs5 TaxID=3423941 RepID=UPI003D33B84B